MLLLLPLLASWTVSAAPSAEDAHPERVLVKAADDGGLRAGEVLFDDVTVDRPLRVPQWYVVSVPSDPEAWALRLATHPAVAWAETDPRLTLDTFADDPSFPEQWGLENLPSRLGEFDADIDVLDAWAQGATGAGVIVAVIDTGVDIHHPGLKDRLWVNPGEIPDNGVDDDGNGVVDDIHGASFVAADLDDVDGHGTACAGLIAAAADGSSTVGIAPEAEIMGVKVFGPGGASGFASNAAEAIVYAADMGADVLSNSWRYGRRERRVVTDAITYAAERGALFVASAGNIPLNTDNGGYQPANTPIEEVVAVAATTRLDELVHFPGLWASAYGESTVELAAPGDGVLTTVPGGGYADFAGTSASAPFVSAVAALIWSVAPDLDALEVKDALVRGVDPGDLPLISRGRLNAGGSVRLALGGAAPLALRVTHEPLRLGHALTFTAHGSDPEAEVQWYFPDQERFAVGRQVVHTFTAPGPWRVVVESTDPEGTRGRAVVPVQLPIPWVSAESPELESQHNTLPNYGAAAIDTGDALWTRLHFERIEFLSTGWASPNAVFLVLDSEGLTAWSFEGSAEDLWTPPLRGGPFALAWAVESDAEGPSWGFRMDAVERFGLSDLPPAADAFSPPAAPSYTLSGGRSCTTGPSPSGALFGPWLLWLFARRRTSAH